MKKVLVLLLLLPSIVYIGKAQQGKLDIYLLMGQSNMAGRGPVTPEIAAEHDPKVLMFTKDKQWVEAKHPLHFDKPNVAATGPGLSFGIAMFKAGNGTAVGLVPCAVGGTSINLWVPGAFDKATNTHPWDDAAERIKEAMKYGTIKGVIWLQGESDSSPERSKGYIDKLTEMIQRVRQLVANPELPFVAGELGRYRERYIVFNKEQLAQLPGRVRYTAVVTSEDLTHKGDTTHFDGPSAREYGRRFANGMLQLQKNIK